MPGQSINQPDIKASDDEVSVKDVLIKVREWISYLLRFWVIFLLAGIIGGTCGFFYAKSHEPKYTAELTFVAEESKGGGGLGNYAGIASQMGIDLGGSGGSGLFQGDNIIALLKSRLLVEKALLAPYPTDTTKNLADVLFDITGYKKRWDAVDRTKNIKFTKANGQHFSLLQDSAIGEMYTYIINGPLDVAHADKKNSFIKASFESTDQNFAKNFLEGLVKEAIDMYIAIKTKRSRLSVDNLQHKADSLLRIINEKTYSAALTQDMNPNPARKMATIDIEISGRDKVIAQGIYGEVIKNLEISKMSLNQDMPVIQVVDSPVLPLKIQQESKKKAAIAWGFVAFVITLIIIAGRRYYKQLIG